MSDLDPFFAEHRRLREYNVEMATLARQFDPPGVEELNDARWRFTRTLLRTLTLKDRMIYPRLRLHADPQARLAAERFCQSTTVDYARFAAHTKRFPPDVVVRDWRAYAVAVRLRTAELEDRMDREERDLFPWIDSAPRVESIPFSQGTNWASDAWRVRTLLGKDSVDDRAA
ncbi:hypothetical protein FPZ54_07285 [Sphingomonas suaedae]|uniref:Hemerythrin domain-containing protein n=1 Tax=Sphingomonas suaedae TaxID=2599297 RepID=A0A518REG0_9SPHN|nr:hypothetical protein [Sphingomonas suaedae]QDX25846.1 hypothetical protein FPZ54_07285 [Sphingomonas suaedae]